MAVQYCAIASPKPSQLPSRRRSFQLKRMDFYQKNLKTLPWKVLRGSRKRWTGTICSSFQTHKGYSRRPLVDSPPTSPVPGKRVSLVSKVEFPYHARSFQLGSQRGGYIHRGFSSLNLFGDRGKWNWIALLVDISNSQIWIFILPFSYLLRIPFRFYPQVLSSISCPFFIFRLITSDFIVILIANVGSSKSLWCSPHLVLCNRPFMSVLSKIATWAGLLTA